MESLSQNGNLSVAQSPKARAGKIGRWSPAQCDLFESLIERYGTNWKQIHTTMKGRSLSQIRSHAQKYFEKIGKEKRESFQKRAKLLEAYQILANEEKLKAAAQQLPQPKIEEVEEESSPQAEELIKEEEHSSTGEEQSCSVAQVQAKESEFVKEQAPVLNQTPKIEATPEPSPKSAPEPAPKAQVQAQVAPIEPRPQWQSPFPFNTQSGSFFRGLLQANAQQFRMGGGSMFAFVDHPFYRQ